MKLPSLYCRAGSGVNAWLTSTRVVSQEEELLRVAVPTPCNKEWLERTLCGKVMAALHRIVDDALRGERVRRVEYIVEAAA